jgi:hypothetical protein
VHAVVAAVWSAPWRSLRRRARHGHGERPLVARFSTHAGGRAMIFVCGFVMSVI